MLTQRIEVHKIILVMLFIASSLVLGAVDAKAENGVTLYFYSDSPVTFDLKKVAKISAATLNKEGISVIAVNKVDKQNLPDLLTRFVVGESAKLKIKITPGATIEGSPLSSYPATITVDLIGIAKQTPVTSITKKARSQHTNPASGLTNAIRIALGPVLKDLSGQLHDLEPWSENSPSILVNSDSGAPTSADETKPIVKIPRATSENLPPLEHCKSKSLSPYLLVASPMSLKPGDRVKIISCYSIRSEQEVKTIIATTISLPNGENIKLKEDSLLRTLGYWKAEFDMKIPEEFAPGTYTLTQVISHEGSSQRLQEKLRVE
jgi:hypothetical protein